MWRCSEQRAVLGAERLRLHAVGHHHRAAPPAPTERAELTRRVPVTEPPLGCSAISSKSWRPAASRTRAAMLAPVRLTSAPVYSAGLAAGPNVTRLADIDTPPPAWPAIMIA